VSVRNGLARRGPAAAALILILCSCWQGCGLRRGTDSAAGRAGFEISLAAGEGGARLEELVSKREITVAERLRVRL